ncbi:MAG: response regulator, partial [Cyanobacteriota bacterium]|nr:response regulator [Cyanobacteriota bacterium]
VATMSEFSILVIDDEPDNFDVIETLLSKQDYQLYYAPSGQEALLNLDTFEPDLILLDVMMPEMDGIEVCQRIKAIPQWEVVPIIVVTALTTKKDLAQCLSAGADDYISKPINSLELKARIKSMLRIRKQYQQLTFSNHKLEVMVEQLESTLSQLYSTQAQLIQAEKMSGLGQLVAGIAHEINNPVSFIYGNLNLTSEQVKSLIDLINLYRKFYPQSPPEIADKIEDIDLDFLIADLPKMLGSMNIGAERIKNIVLSLRNFSRLDEAELKPVDIHSGIDSTLLILQHQLHSNPQYPEIKVIKKYSQLPKITCYASQLNQVFLNIFSNAIDALQSKQINKPIITINTSLNDDKNILVSIKDNGKGIDKSVLNKIFDPFFTTKTVGSGTGLGLSTSYSIVVEKHGGNLKCNSVLGEGAEFLIELPIK